MTTAATGVSTITSLLVVLSCQGAAGQSLAGTWTAGATSIDVRVESWGPDCGPEPKSSRTAGGGEVQVSLAGQEVVIHGRDHDIRTDRCWSPNPAMRRRSSRAQNGSWVLQCRTPDSDAEEEVGTYTLTSSGSDELRYRDESHYNWQLRSSRCVATIVTTQVLRRNLAAIDSTATGQQTSTCKAEAASRLVLRPTHAEIGVNEELCVRAVASDAQGCALNNPPIRYTLEHPPGVQGSLRNQCFRSSKQAATGEGVFKIVATLGSLRAETTVVVAAIDMTSLIAKRLDGTAVTGFEATPQDKPVTAVASAPAETPATRTGVRAQNAAKFSAASPWPMAAGMAAAIALALTAAFLRRKRVHDLDHPSAEVYASEMPGSLEPSTRLTEDDSSTIINELDSGPQSRDAAGSSAPRGGPPNEAWICPVCRRGFPAALQSCPNCSGEVRLLPYSRFAATAARIAPKKRCGRCGAQCPGAAQFCGECGSSQLENLSPDP